MKKYLKYAFTALAAITVLLVGLAAFVVATFDPNAYKPEIIQLVREKKQRELKLDGDIKLSFFPGAFFRIGADFGKLSLSEHNSAQEFATVENARVSLALLPLLKKQLIVKEIVIKGLRAHLVRHQDGRTNIDDLLAKDAEKSEQFKFDIDRVLVENTTLNFLDETKGSQVALTNINLKTGRITNGVPDKLELAFNTQINPATRLKTRLMVTLDPAPQPSNSIRSGAMTLELESSKNNLVIQAKLASSLTGNLETRQLHLPNLTVAISTAGTDVSDIKGDLQGSVTLDGVKQNVQVNLAGKVADSNIRAKLEAAGFAKPAYNFDVNIDQLDLDRFLPPQQALVGRQWGKQAGREADARKSEAPDETPNHSTRLSKDNSQVADYSAAGKHPADYGRSPVSRGNAYGSSALQSLNANGSIRIASLKTGNIKSSNARLEIKANKPCPPLPPN